MRNATSSVVSHCSLSSFMIFMVLAVSASGGFVKNKLSPNCAVSFFVRSHVDMYFGLRRYFSFSLVKTPFNTKFFSVRSTLRVRLSSATPNVVKICWVVSVFSCSARLIMA